MKYICKKPFYYKGKDYIVGQEINLTTFRSLGGAKRENFKVIEDKFHWESDEFVPFTNVNSESFCIIANMLGVNI